jgi:L-fuculose-phosphate aldolase
VLLGEVRAEVAAVCCRLAAEGLVVGTAGNVSARSGGLVAITPSGLDYQALTAGLVGVHRLDGPAVEAPLEPSTELPLHLGVYAETGATAIVHTHSPAATAVSALVDEVPPIHYQVAAFGGPVAVAPYATYGTPELAAGVVRALAGRTACLIANHGAVTIGPDLKTAYTGAVVLEWLCDVYLRAAAAGNPRLLPPDEIDRVVRKFAGYGQRAPDEASPGVEGAGAGGPGPGRLGHTAPGEYPARARPRPRTGRRRGWP